MIANEERFNLPDNGTQIGNRSFSAGTMILPSQSKHKHLAHIRR